MSLPSHSTLTICVYHFFYISSTGYFFPTSLLNTLSFLYFLYIHLLWLNDRTLHNNHRTGIVKPGRCYVAPVDLTATIIARPGSHGKAQLEKIVTQHRAQHAANEGLEPRPDFMAAMAPQAVHIGATTRVMRPSTACPLPLLHLTEKVQWHELSHSLFPQTSSLMLCVYANPSRFVRVYVLQGSTMALFTDCLVPLDTYALISDHIPPQWIVLFLRSTEHQQLSTLRKVT